MNTTMRNRVLGAIAGMISVFVLLFGASNFSTKPPPLPMHAAFAVSPSGALLVGNTAVNGPIGGLTAAQSVDNYNSFVLTQTTSGIVATLPTPTNATPGRQAIVSSLASNAPTLTMYGVQVSPGSTFVFQWDGTEWSTSLQVASSSAPKPFSYVQMAASLADAGTPISTFSVSAGNYTVGMEFYTTTSGHACSGAEIWWVESDAGADTVQLELWDSLGSGTHLATTTVTASNGYTSGTWNTPITLVPGKLYLVSYYVLSNSFTPFWGATPAQASGGGQFLNPSSNNQRGNSGNQVGGVPIGYDMWMSATGNAVTGHAKPTSLNTLGGSPVSPIAPLFSQ